MVSRPPHAEILAPPLDRRVDELLREVPPLLRGELERSAAEDSQAGIAEGPAAGEAEEELVGDVLRGCHLPQQREAGAREPGHARGAPHTKCLIKCQRERG